MAGLRNRSIGTAVVGILLALPAVLAWAGGDERHPRGAPPMGGGHGGGGGEMHRPHSPDEDRGRVQELLERHPKFGKVWEGLSEEQRMRCVEKVCQKLNRRRERLGRELEGMPETRRRDKLRKLKATAQRNRELSGKELKAWLEKRRKREARPDR